MKKSTMFGLALSGIHTVAVIWLLLHVLNSDQAGAGFAWLLLIYADWPASLLVLGMPDIFPDGGNWDKAITPAIAFGVVGGLWWFVVGKVLGVLSRVAARKIRRLRSGKLENESE